MATAIKKNAVKKATKTAKETSVEATKALSKPAKSETVRPLPLPMLGEPEVPSIDLTQWQQDEVPIPTPDGTSVPDGPLTFEGYSLHVLDDGTIVVNDAKGKPLKSVPTKLRKSEDYQAFMRGRKDERTRERRARFIIEERMVEGRKFDAQEMAWYAYDSVFQNLLKGLVFVPNGRVKDAGILVNVTPEKGLGLLPLDYDAHWAGWVDAEIAHPSQLGDLTAWQDLLVEQGVSQVVPQVFRELRTAPSAHMPLTESNMLAGRNTRSALAIEKALTDFGWTPKRGTARRRFFTRATGDNPSLVCEVFAWFDYGEVYMPFDPTTTGAFGFFSRDKRALRLDELAPILLSETIRSLEVCLAQAGASNKEDDEEVTDDDDVDDDE